MKIPYGRQSIDEDDIAAVTEVLRSDWLTQGPTVTSFEEAISSYCGARQAVSVVNATAALHIACLALELGPGKRLWTSPNTFLASANCGRYCGAEVDFVDIDPRTYCMSADKLQQKLEAAKKSNLLPSVVVTVAFAGQSAEADRIFDLSREYGFAIIDDASHALGALYKGERVGSGRFADITVLSFHPVKILTTGEGGIALTNSPDLYERMAKLRNHGMIKDEDQLELKNIGPWYYEQQSLGFNYRLTDIQAALGVSQMGKLARFLSRRRALAARYNTLLSASEIVLPWQDPNGTSAFHLYPIQVPRSAARERVFNGMRMAGVGVQVHYIPVTNQPYYRALGIQPKDFPEAQAYYERAMSLPLFPDLTDGEQDRVVEILLDLVDKEKKSAL